MQTLYEINDTVINCNTEITDIIVNNFTYKITRNIKLNLFFCKTNNTKQIEERINIIISNNYNLTINDIVKIIMICVNPFKDKEIIYNEDKYSIFDISAKSCKYKHDKSFLYNKFFNSKSACNYDKTIINTCKELLLNDKQFYTLIISEIDKINSNNNYYHYICCNNNDITDLNIRFVYTNGELGDKMSVFNTKHGFNYFEINMKLSRMYPFIPPTIKYVKPRIDIELISNIYNMNLWDYKVWTYSITLDYIVNNLGDLLEPLFNKYIDMDNNQLDIIDSKMIELNSITKIDNCSKLNLNITNNITSIPNNRSSWKLGTGYGSGNNTESWDISKFIDINKTKSDRIVSILKEINSNIKYNQLLYNYIESKFIGLNLLSINTEIDIYIEIISIIKNIQEQSIDPDNSLIMKVVYHSKDIYDELNNIITNENLVTCIEEKYMIVYLYIIEIINKFNKETNKIDSKVSNDYEKMFKENSFGVFKLTNNHKFYDKKNLHICPKTIMRIISEISSLKKDTPINWDSSVAIRTCSTNANYVSFIISGPKDTPYHNGLFEFHAYFPDKYPSSVPSVLINTTDNGRVRFNPNLYANGKVCLSLLGTWSGEKGESWIPEISTFFQVIISIQSLIFVDEPYYNEPGYEKSINTDTGKKNSFNYNDNIRLETVKVAMIKMLENPPESYETLIQEHFKYKKDEILKIVDKWTNESINKEEFNKYYSKLKDLLYKL